MKESHPWDNCDSYKHGKCTESCDNLGGKNPDKHVCCYKCKIECTDRCGYYNPFIE